MTTIAKTASLFACISLVSCASSGSRAPNISYGPAPGYGAAAKRLRPTVANRRSPGRAPTATAVSADSGGSTYAPSSPPPAKRPAARPSPPPMAKRSPARTRESAGAAVALRRGSRSDTVIIIPGRKPRPTPAARVQIPPPRANLLTAASVGDHDRFENYLSYLTRHASQRAATGLSMNRRVRMRVLDAKGDPINDAAIVVSLRNQRVVNGRTHADGYWDFFPSVSAPQSFGPAAVTISVGGQTVRANITLPRSGGGQQLTVKLPQAKALRPRVLDLAFAIDVTGSMSDELRYVNREIADIVRRIKSGVPNTTVRVGAVFYRDRVDSKRLQMLRFTTDIAGFGRAMKGIRAGGGGDYPEDMNAGLGLAMRSLRWSKGNAARVLVLLADAPPKRYADATYRYKNALVDAARRGIRILPVAASGANRTVEYLFRAMGAFTSTPYVYLTDDSGVGGRHMEADTDRVGIEKFNQLLTRLVISDLSGKGMHEPGALGPR